MEVKTGYKQTEVGVIPEDWSIAPLETVTPPNVKNSIVDGPFGSNLKTIHYRNSGIPIITSGYVTDGKFRAEKYLYVDQAKFNEEKRSAVQPGDIVMAKIGERCGASAMLPATHKTGILSGNVLKITVDQMRHSTFYVWQVLWNLYSSGDISLLKTVGAQPAISMANLKKHKILFPPTKAEEETIAEALSDTDTLIESLEQLLGKKRQIKQGAMQELLTGKKRLPGFTKEWETIYLRDLLSYERPDRYIVRDTEYVEQGEIPVLTANQSFILGYTIEDFGICRDLPVIIFDDFTTDSKYVDFPFKVKSSAIKILRPKHDRVDLRFVFGLIQLIDFPFGDHKRYYISEYQNLDLKLPKFEEQKAIATVLFDMDAEIATLESKLAKAHQLKQGMMQELLTGRIRLI